jgi:hypothetical protein
MSIRHVVRVSLTRSESIQTDDPLGRRGSSTRNHVVPSRTRALSTSSATGPPLTPSLGEIFERGRPRPGADQAGVAMTMWAIQAARALGAAEPIGDTFDGPADEAFDGPVVEAFAVPAVASTAAAVPITTIARTERIAAQPVTAGGGGGGGAPTSFTLARTLRL